MTPRPGTAANSPAGDRLSPASRAAATIARASGCSDGFSADAASRSTVFSPATAPGSTLIPASRGVPSVSVPVLSKATRMVVPTRSITTADFTSTPWRPALAIAASSGGIVARTTAQGEATIMNVMARSRVGWNAAPASSGTANSSSVAATMPSE